MAFTREYIRSAAKESGVEIPKELEDALVKEHIASRDGYANEQVKTALAENKPKEVVIKDSQEYKDLEKQFNDYKTEQEQKETRAAKENAYRELLKAAGVNEKRIDAVMKVSDIDGIELADGKIKDAETLTETVKTEWADFIGTTPGGDTKPIVKMDTGGSLGGGKPDNAPTSLRSALYEKYNVK